MSRRAALLGLLLALATLGLYWPALDHGFLLLDDEGYVTGNPFVRAGLTREGAAWAFGSVGHAGNWHPLTWLSHQFDVTLFGLSPRGHHLANLLLHAANTLLLFGALRALTGALWRSAAVAFLFAAHPLHVESVAWISERKDLLCAFFTLAAVRAYLGFSRNPGWARALGVTLLTALALLAKPMAVTLPFVLLLLDLWPLGRWPRRRSGFPLAAPPGRLLLEKLPLLALAGAAGAATWLAQQRSGSLTPAEFWPLPRALANALVSYAAYVGKALWPAKLSAFYPYPPLGHSSVAVAGAALLLVAISAVALLGLRRRPWLAVGWLWFLGMLVPVIGLVRVGGQAMADRYTYLPLVGLGVMLAWGVPGAVARPAARRLVSAAAALLALPLLAVTRLQIGHWRDDAALAAQAIAVTRDNWFMHFDLGLALSRQGRLQEAIGHYREAVRIRPGFDRAWNNLGAALQALGRHAEAGPAFETALRANPRSADVRYNLAITLAATRRLREAEGRYREAIALDPANSDALANLGELLLRQGRIGEAVATLERALGLNPEDPYARANLGRALRLRRP